MFVADDIGDTVAVQQAFHERQFSRAAGFQHRDQTHDDLAYVRPVRSPNWRSNASKNARTLRAFWPRSPRPTRDAERTLTTVTPFCSAQRTTTSSTNRKSLVVASALISPWSGRDDTSVHRGIRLTARSAASNTRSFDIGYCLGRRSGYSGV